MIYISYIIIFAIAIITNKNELLSTFSWLMFFISIIILPIWWTLRECAKELGKIRHLLEKIEGE